MDKNNSEAWTIAALTRAKKLPKLSEMMIAEKPEKTNMEKSLKQALENLSRKK